MQPVNLMTKPIIQATVSDFANVMNRISKQSKTFSQEIEKSGICSEITPEMILEQNKLWKIFNPKTGNLNNKGEKEIIQDLINMGYDSDAIMSVTMQDYIELLVNRLDGVGKNVDIII